MDPKHLATIARLASDAINLAVTANEATEIWRYSNRLVEQVRGQNRAPTEEELRYFRDRIGDRGAAIDALALGEDDDGDNA